MKGGKEMEDNMTNRDLLESRLATDFENLDNVKGEERKNLINDIAALYKLKVEEEKVDADFDDKYNRRQMEEEHFKKECELKQKELELRSKQEKHNWIIGLTTAGVTAAIALAGNIFYSIWYHKGLKFEETGTVSTHQTKNLESKMVPKR